jgi:serine/threonine protein kinase/tetratricopeptide (TPR) repeat protein
MSASAVQIGHYAGIPVGEGGFATVYRAFDHSIGISVALKWAHAAADVATVASLHHEFRLLGEFDFSQLPRALDFGWADNRPYLVTDWIEGPELWEHPHTESAEFFTETLRQIARLLVFVHHRGWVHGDLKPGNFRWGPPREQCSQPGSHHESSLVLYLLDFGLARRTGDTERPRGAGTVGYYAPEFLRCLPADGRADWYSVGAILYEWLYGRRPFAADDPAVEIAGHLEQVPHMADSFIRPAPEWARDVTLRLLSKEPDQRGQDVYDLLQWLGQFDSGLSPDAILNEQVAEHHRSEGRRLDGHDVALLEQVSKAIASQDQVRGVIAADRTSRARLSRGLVCTVLELGPGMSIESRDTSDLPGASTSAELPANQLRIRSNGPHGIVGGLIVDFVPMPDHELLGTYGSGDSPNLVAALHPWDAQRVADHLMGLTRDEVFSQRFAESIWKATGGLPGVVADLFSHAVSLGQLRRHAGCWELDESSITGWQVSPEAGRAYDEYLGAMTADERRLCDWLAVGRSRLGRGLVRELSALGDARFESACAGLVKRGVVVLENAEAGTNQSEIRFRLGGLSEAWRAQLPAAQRRSQAALLAERLESAEASADRTVHEVLTECFADALQWAKCARHAIEAAGLNIKIEHRDDALRYIHLAESAAQQITDPIARAHWLGRAMMARGDCEKSFGQIDDARHTYRGILALGRQYGDLRLLAETLKDLGDLYKMTRQFEKGVRVLRRARQLWETIGDRDEVARTLNNLGNMYWVASDRSQARRYYEEALDVARALQADEVVALVLSNLGVTYKGDHDFARAEALYRESLAIKERLGSPVETARTLNNLGVIALDRGQLPQASEYLERAADLNERAGAATELLCNRGMLIHVALERGDLRTVIRESLRALEDAESLGDVATGAELRGLLAEAYLRAGDFRLASAYLQEAREQASGQRNDDLNAHLGLVAATRLWHLGQGKQAVATLDDIEHHLSHSEFPRLLLDAQVLRMRAAVSQQDVELTERLWRKGQELALAVGAAHKLAQLAFARLPEDPASGYSREARRLAQESFEQDDRLHWTGAFQLWEARRSAAEEDLESAGRAASDAITRLREDGNWETLWRALVVAGGIDFRRADYEPALTAFEEADRIMHEIGKTIEDSEYRASYTSHPLAKRLSEARNQILELTR